MKSFLSWIGVVVLGFLMVVESGAAAPAEQAQIDALKKTYPLTTCPISGEKLGSRAMGGPVDYLYTGPDANGKPTTRLVRFCCPGCISQFQKNPNAALAKIDAAAAKK